MKKLISMVLILIMFSTAVMSSFAEARAAEGNPQAAGVIPDEISNSLMNSVTASLLGESMGTVLVLGGESGGSGDGSGGGTTPVVMTNGYTQLDLQQLLDNSTNNEDTDDDSLPDEVEKILGTDPESKDSDQDQLDDLFELTNQLNPLEPDSNGDGMPDYTEIVKWGDLQPGESDVDITLDTDGDGIPNLEDRDNDNDGVPDGLDLSPFSYGEPQDEYTITIKTEGNATYADFQIQPKDLENLYKNVQSYDWPYDQEGNIQDSDYSRKDMTVKPVLEVETDNMPSYDDSIKYGIVPNEDDGKLYIPLMMVEDNGKKVALQGRIFVPAGQTETTLKARLLWSMEFNNDHGNFEFQAQPSPVFAGKKEWEGAGVDTWDLDGNGKPDVIVAGIVNGESSHSFWYTIGYDMDAGGNVKGWSSLKRVPVTFPGRAIDGGVALYDFTGDGKPEVLFESLEDVTGKDKMSYVIGYDLDEYGNVALDDNGNPKWSPVTPGPQVLDINSGSGAAVADLDGSGKPELIFMTIDNPSEADNLGYTILWNFDIDNKNADGRFNYGTADWGGMVWSNPIGWSNAGGDIEVADLDGNGVPDFVLTDIDDPDGTNKFRYDIAWNVNTSGANRGRPAGWSGVNVPPASLGSYSWGCGIAIEDFDGDGDKDDILLLDVDDPHGGRNSLWYWVAMDFRQNNAAWVGQKTVDSAEDIGLGSVAGLENKMLDLNGNGLGDMLLGWITSDGYFRYRIGWDFNARTQAKYWGPVKSGFSHEVNGYINGLGFDTFDINRNGKPDLFVLWNDGSPGMKYRIGWDLNEEGNVTGGWYINQFASDIFYDYPDTYVFDQKLKGLGVAIIDKDYEPYTGWAYENWPDRVADVLIAVRDMSNNSTNYNYDTYTFVEYALDEAGHMVDPAWTKGQWSVGADKPRDPDHFDPDDDEYEQYDKYDKYNMVMKRQYGVGLDIYDINGDGKQDAVMTTADGPGENQIRQFTFYNIEDRDVNLRPKEPDNVVTRPLEDYINSVNGLSDDEVFADGWRKRGLGTSFYDITGNGNAEAISAMVEKEGGELVLNLFTAYDLETSEVNILQESEPFRLTGLSLEENGGGEAGIIHVQPWRTQQGAYEDAMLNYEVLRQKYLNELEDIETASQVIDTDFDAPDPARTITSFTHMDEVNPFIDGFLRDLDGNSNYKDRNWPFVVAVTNSSRRLTMDNLEKWKISGSGLTFDLTELDFNETRLLQMKTYDFVHDTTLDTVDIVDLVSKDDGLGSGTGDQEKAQLAELLLEWNSGEIHLVSVGNTIVFTPPPQQSKIYKYLAGATASFLPFAQMSRINFKGTVILKELYANIRFSQNAYPLRYKNIYAYSKAFDSYSKANKGLSMIPGKYRAVRTAIGKSPFRGLKGILTNGTSLSKILKWGSTAAILVQFGFNAYAGYQMAQQFDDQAYGSYAGSVYGALQATYAVIMLMVPLVVKSIIRGLAGTGIGLAIVVVVELSDFITYLSCGKGWSQMAIEKIFNYFVGQGMDVSVDIKSIKDDITYENVPNGLFIVGSKVRDQSVWQGIVTDIFRPYYNSQSDIGENYMIPYVYYPNKSDYYDRVNKANKDGSWITFTDANDLRSQVDEPSYRASEKWIKEDGLWTEITEYQYDNTLAFNAVRINMPVKIAREYDYKMHKWKKKNGHYESGGFVTGSDNDATTLYFDVMPQGLTAFRSGFKLVDSYINNAETETQQQSRERVDRNEIVKLDPDGDGLMTWGTKEKTPDGKIIDTSPTNWDTDGDGVGDDFEVAMGMNPLSQDTDGDGLSDWWELYYKTSPRLVDDNNDGDYADDGDEDGRDTDGDGLTDKEELDGWNITFTYNGQSIAAHVRTNPLSADTDGDGLTDKEEKDNGINPASQYTPRPMLEGESWDLLWDGNDHAPSVKAEIPGEENAQDGQQYTRNLADYFEDLDGDPLTYTADVGEVTADGNWRYTYRVPEGEASPVITVTVAAYDNRGTGKAVQSFILSDTTNPVLTYAQLNISDGMHTWPNRWDYQNWDVYGIDPGITIYFSEPVSPGPNFGGIRLTDSSNNTVETTNTCDGNKLLINPATPLAEDKNEYKLVVPAGVVQDDAALASENGFEGSFTTRDATRPQVVGTPAENTGIGPYDELTFSFHEDTKRSYPYQDAYIVQRVQVQNLPPAYEYQRVADVDFSIGKLNLNTGDYEMKNTVTFTLGQDRGLLDNSSSLDLPGYPYYKLRLEPGFVEDMAGNDLEAYEWPLATGDVNSPVLVPGGDWGLQEGKPLITVNSATPAIELTYNEDLYPGVNFAQIRVEHETKQNQAFWSPFSDLDRPGLPVSDLLDEALKVPATVELDGNILRVTITEQPLIQNYLYRIVVPKGALADANGTETSVRSEMFMTYGTVGAAPEVIWTGSLTNGQLIPGDDPASDILDPGASLGIVFNMPVTQNGDVWNDSDKPCPITLVDQDGNSVPHWPQWQSTRLDDMYYALQLNLDQPLKANATYTLTVPANTVENAFGQERTDGPVADFVKEFTTRGTLELPGVESLQAFGVLRAGEPIYGLFKFKKYNNMFEGESLFQWYVSDDASGTNMQPIDGAATLRLEIPGEYAGKYLWLEVTPNVDDGTETGKDLFPYKAGPFGPVQDAFSTNMDLGLLEVETVPPAGGTPDIVLSATNTTEPVEQYYNLAVGTDVTEVTVRAEAYDVKSTVWINNTPVNELTIPLKLGANPVTVSVTGESGIAENLYTLTINRSLEGEALLLSPPEGFVEILAEGNIYPGMVLQATSYFYDSEDRDEGDSLFKWYRGNADGSNLVPVGEGLYYEVTPEDTGYYLFVEMTPVTSHGIGGEPVLSPGAGPVMDTQLLRAQIYDLTDLSVNTGAKELINNFTPELTSYERSVGMDVTQVTVAATASPEGAVVKVNGQDGTAPVDVVLNEGNNPITITVERPVEGGTEAVKTYLVTVNRTSGAIPQVSDVRVTGTAQVGEMAVGEYVYAEDEANSIYTWYLADNPAGRNKTIAATMTGSYAIQEGDEGGYLFFEVQPGNSNGILGDPVYSPAFGPIGGQQNASSILAVELSPTSHITGTAQAIQVAVTTSNVADGTETVASFVYDQDDSLIPIVIQNSTIINNTAVLTLNTDAGIPAGNYKVKVEVNGIDDAFLIDYMIYEQPQSAFIASTVPTVLTEAASNDGSLSNGTVVITIANGTLADSLVKADVTAANLPAGLDYSVARDSDTQLTIMISGNAANHANANDVSNLTFTIAQAKVTGATGDLTTANISIDFNDPAGSDTTAPTVADGTITASGLTDSQVTLSWNKATDNVSAQGALQYLVYRSVSNNIDTVENIEANGTAIGSYAADINTREITSLTAGTTYYFNVIVKDEAGNKTAYTMKEVTTSAAPASSTKGRAGVTIITHGWNIDDDEPLWTTSMQNAIIQNSLGGEGQAAKITVTGTKGNLSVASDPWDLGLAESTNGQIVVRVDWSAVANNLTSGVTAQEVAVAIAPYVYQGQNGQPPLAELPIHLIGHSRGGGMVYDLANLLGEQGIEVEQLTSLDPHPLTGSDPQDPLNPAIDTPIGGVPENVLFADNYWQNISYPQGQAVDGAYNREFISLPGGYHNSGSAYSSAADHLNIVLMYQGTINTGDTVNNGEATMSSTERSSWFNADEDSGAKTGFYYSGIGSGNRKSTDTPVSGGDQVIDGYHNDTILGGEGARQALTWTDAAWPNVITVDILRDGQSIGTGTQTITPGEQLDLSYTYRAYAGNSTVTFYADRDRNPYNDNNLAALATRDLTATGSTITQSTAAWNTTELSSTENYYVYAKITDGTRTRYLYAAPAIQESAAPVTYTITIEASVYGTATGGGTFNQGQSVTLGANPNPGYNFNGWYEGATKVSSLPNYSFTAERDITLTPSFAAMPKSFLEVTTVGGGAVKLNNEPANLSANYKLEHTRGSGIRLTATANEGYVFAYWEDVRSASIISTSPVYEAIMGAGINIKAVFNKIPDEATTEFTVIFKDKSGKILQSTSVAKHANANHPATPALVGYSFKGWDQDFTDVTADLTINALYERIPDTYPVTVVGGTLSTGGTTGSFQFDMPVTVVAGAAPTGQKFSHWEQDGVKISINSTFTFFAPMKATTLTAVFVAETTVIVEVPFITLSEDVLVDTVNKTMTFTANRTVPDGYTLVESGVMLLQSNTPLSGELTVDTENAIRGKIKNDSTAQFYIRKSNITDGDTWYARAYLIYQDADGNVVTVYSGNTVNRTME